MLQLTAQKFVLVEQSTDCFPSVRRAAPLLTGLRAAHHCLQLHFLLDTVPLKQARAPTFTPCFLDKEASTGRHPRQGWPSCCWAQPVLTVRSTSSVC